MKKADRIKSRLLTGVIALVLGLGIFGVGFTQTGLVSHAESQAKVTAPKGANIRKEASTSSAAVGGAENGKVLTVISQVQGSDGNTWYQVKSGDITGYIRSDLVEVSEGSVPSEGGEGGSGEGGGATPSDVMAVNPITATVSGDSGKVRDSASSEGQIIQEVPADTMLTVTGQATDADGRTWYQVSFVSGETQVEGFIRYDYVTLAGELTPLTQDPPVPEEEGGDTDPEPETKLYDTVLQDGDWLLVDNTGESPEAYSISEIFSGVEKNRNVAEENEKIVKNQKVVIIILVFLLVAAAAGIAFLVFKVRDMMDSAYFNEVEKETIRKKNSGDRDAQRTGRSPGQERTSDRPAGARSSGYGQRTSGYSQGERTGAQGQRPAGAGQSQRPAGPSQGQRASGSTQGARPAGTAQSQRPAGSGQSQRPAGMGQRPAGASQGQRPVRTMQEARPAGAEGPRPLGSVQDSAGSQGIRAAGTQPGTRRPVGGSQAGRAAESVQRGGAAPNTRPARPAQAHPQKAQSRNFIADDDDDGFENEFLNYDE
ncbi:MAG: SH3 domain-containing protein [Lachnospiraceae bacterium]|nr:SH3 domain-containing protein [Lachnospiraceae bacterium]